MLKTLIRRDINFAINAGYSWRTIKVKEERLKGKG